MSVQNINNTGISAGTPATSPAPLPASPTAPAAPAGETAQEVTGGNQPVKQEGAQSSPKAAGQPNTAAPAVLVDLESFLTTELAALSKLLSSRAAVVNKLPPEIKELVQNILKQTQPAQTALPDGLAALLKSSGTSAEKLVLLANALEEAAGLTAKPGEQPAAGLAAGKQQALQVLAKALNSGNPDELKAAAAILRELANTAESSGDQPAVRQNTAAGRQQIPAAVLQTGGLPVAQPGAVAVPAASGDVKGQQAMPAAASTGSTPAAEPQDLPPALSLPANQAHEQQDMNAGVTRPAAGQQPPAGLPLQPGRLPVETEEMVRMAPQTASQAEGEQEPAAALPRQLSDSKQTLLWLGSSTCLLSKATLLPPSRTRPSHCCPKRWLPDRNCLKNCQRKLKI
ncbi:hypothetical protein [Sporomusa aerivorans]|uniref:hypothetical protein n=1 Tax=Sporomusa aerivorans TaxID=204936 RepID=UPI00352B8FE9